MVLVSRICRTTSGPDKPPPSFFVRVLIVHEEVGFGAGSPDLLDFLLFAATREEIEQRLPAALEAFCGEPVAFKILRPKEH